MSVHKFPQNGELFWRVIEPQLREILPLVRSPEVVDQVLGNLAPVIRRVGDLAYAGVQLPPDREESVVAINRWINGLLFSLIAQLAIRETQLIDLRTERDDLLAQLRDARKPK